MKANEWTGVLPVDKPVGPTSHDVVARARKALGIRRIGHTGTLDPFASGLLLLCVGVATRIAEYLSDQRKTYRAIMTLGTGTDTDDSTGAVIASSEAWHDLSRSAVEAALYGQTGRILQRPPAFSAKKVGGERVYRMAREGRAPVLDAVPVEVFRMHVIEWEPPDVTFDVTCSAGTYIRALARDAGESLGVPAHLRALRRTAVGTFTVDHALTLDELSRNEAVEGALLSPLAALAHMTALSIEPDDVAALAHGRTIPVDASASGLAAAALDDRLVAIVEAEGGMARPRKVFV